MHSILILGATSDIGKAIASFYASKQYNIMLASRNTADLDNFKRNIEIRFNTSCTVYAFDATAFDTHQSFFDGLPMLPDVTVCVFGYMTENEVAFRNQSEMLKTLNTNYTGAVSILNIVADQYIRAGKGTIAGISSVAGERGRQSNFLYGSAKAGFTAYLSGLRNFLFHHSVHVVTILPGFVYTKMTAGLQLPALLTAQPEDVAKTVDYAITKKKNVVYVKWFWRYIMYIIKFLPEFIFKRKKL